jgi:hypothetical protein
VRAHPARRLWATLETLHDVTYFADGVRPAGVALGLKGFWMTYFAFRAAPLGPVPAAVVIAAFGGFRPAMVARALPDAWSRTTPRTDERAWTGGLSLLGEQGVEEVVALLQPSVRAVVSSGILPEVNPAGLPYPG